MVMLKICKHTFYAYVSRIWKLMQFTCFIRKVFATKILLSGKFLPFLTLQVTNFLFLVFDWTSTFLFISLNYNSCWTFIFLFFFRAHCFKAVTASHRKTEFLILQSCLKHGDFALVQKLLLSNCLFWQVKLFWNLKFRPPQNYILVCAGIYPILLQKMTKS